MSGGWAGWGMTNPIRETDEEARRLAAQLLTQARIAALATLPDGDGFPMVTRIAVAVVGEGLFALISDLAAHSKALRSNPACSLLVGEPAVKGDPLVHPRMTLYARASFLDQAEKESLRAAYLERHPKAGLYFDFTDFRMVRFEITRADLNGGFGKAYQLSAEDLPVR